MLNIKPESSTQVVIEPSGLNVNRVLEEGTPEVSQKPTNDSSFPDRVRFNWGFHDGTAEAERAKVREMDQHPDRVYAAGYVRGVLAWKNLGYRPETSDEAWSTFQGHRAGRADGENPENEIPGPGECQTYLYDDGTDSGFIIRNEGNGLFKAEEWRNGDIADITYGPYAQMKAWTDTESSSHNAWRTANGYGSLPLRTLSELYGLWDALRDVPVTEDGRNLDGAFLHFSKGVETETVWRWFEAQNPKFIVGDVQRGIRHTASNQESATVSQVARTPWERDDVQFPRLLAEILATQNSLDKKALADSMGLSLEQVATLFDRAAATWEAFQAKSALEANGASSTPGLTEVRKAVLQYTVLHDDDIDLSTISLEEIGKACREGGYIGGDLIVVSDEHLTQSQLDVEAARLGADPTFFCIEGDDDAPAPPSF